MHHIVYVSSTVGVTDEHVLKQILTQSRTNNKVHHITGVLLLSEDKWMQVLEGNREEVATMFRTIEQDPRHTNVCKLSDGPIAGRSFADWSMGFTTALPEELERMLGQFAPGQPDFPVGQCHQPATDIFDLLKEFCREREVLF